MVKVYFDFINDKGELKSEWVFVDEETFKMLSKLEEIVKIDYLRELYYERKKEEKYRLRISSVEEICAPKKNKSGEEVTFEFPDSTDIEKQFYLETKIKETVFQFNKEEREIIKKVKIGKVSATEFGRQKGQTQQNISKKLKKINEKLKKINSWL